MTNTKKSLLETRKRIKKSKPWFVIRESKYQAGLKCKWRGPRGRHSATRQRHRGSPAIPRPGYGSPREVRGLSPEGLAVVLVSRVEQLDRINPAEEGVMISSGLGMRKRVILLKKAAEKKLTVLNSKNLIEKIKSLETNFEERKRAKKEKLSEKSKKEEQKKKKAEETEKKKKEEAEKAEKEKESNKGKDAGEKADQSGFDDKQTEEKKMVDKELTKRQ
jgi:large subunit ribosomal protein L32e